MPSTYLRVWLVEEAELFNQSKHVMQNTKLTPRFKAYGMGPEVRSRGNVGEIMMFNV